MQKTAYEMRISDWSSDVCSSDLRTGELRLLLGEVNALANDKLPDNLMAASDVVAQTRTALVEAQGDITQIDQKPSVLRDSADAVRAASQTGVEALDTGLSAATDRVAALTAQLEASRTRLQAIESEAGDRKSTRLNTS